VDLRLLDSGYALRFLETLMWLLAWAVEAVFATGVVCVVALWFSKGVGK